MISYKPFLKLLIDRDISKTTVMRELNISSSTMAKLSKNEPVSMNIVDKLCEYLSCQPGELIEYIPNKNHSEDD